MKYKIFVSGVQKELKAVKYLKVNRQVTITSFKALFPNVSKKTLYRDLQDLVSKNVFKETGEKRGRKYHLR